jgi:Tol biopolymer transport system component
MPASSRDHRVTTGFFRPNGTLIRKLPLPGDGLNLGCAQAFSPVTGQLACEGWSDKHPALNGVYTVRASDGGDLRRLTRNPEHDISAGFSPNGSQILFFRPVDSVPSYGDTPEGSLYVVTSNGKSLHRVTPANMPVEAIGNAGGRLSPDGKWIAFTSSGVIWKIHPDGSGMTRVFDDRQGRLAITPTWSPDGTYILFGLDPRESLGTVQTAPANGLYVIRADGSGLAPVITSNDFKREPDWTGTS